MKDNKILIFLTGVSLTTIAFGLVIAVYTYTRDSSNRSPIDLVSTSPQDEIESAIEDNYFDINAERVVLENDWRILTLNISYKNLNKDDGYNSESDVPAGAYPILRDSGFSLTNSISFISFSRKPLFVPGGFGGYAFNPLPTDYTVVKKPQSDYEFENAEDNALYGYGYRTVDEGQIKIREYNLIVSGDCDDSPDTKELCILPLRPGGIMKVATDSPDIKYAESLYEQICIQNIG